MTAIRRSLLFYRIMVLFCHTHINTHTYTEMITIACFFTFHLFWISTFPHWFVAIFKWTFNLPDNYLECKKHTIYCSEFAEVCAAVLLSLVCTLLFIPMGVFSCFISNAAGIKLYKWFRISYSFQPKTMPHIPTKHLLHKNSCINTQKRTLRHSWTHCPKITAFTIYKASNVLTGHRKWNTVPKWKWL